MLVGKTIGPFIIEKEIGAGAMGSVFRAKHVETGKPVAIKVVATGLADNESVKQRFEREWEILKQLKHPNIVRLVANGRIAGTPFYAMEYVEGESLDRVMARRGRISWEEVVELGQQLCAGLQHAHDKGIIHRDLKPSNLMVLKDGTAKLTDFGIAKDLDRTSITEANCTVGTASYMSPEQCRGERNLTTKSDLYSMGVMFYELLTGKKPFEADSAFEMFMQHVKGRFERPSRLALEIPVFLDTLVCQLMEKDPERRPYSAQVVAEALGRVAEKVLAQQAAGIDAARTANRDKPPEAARLEEEDKEAARALLGKKKQKRKNRESLPFYYRPWFKATGLGLALLGVIGALAAFLLVEPSAATLFKSAEKVKTEGDHEQLVSARKDGPIHRYLSLYDTQEDEQTRKIRAWSDEIDMSEAHRLVHVRRQFNIRVDGYELDSRKAVEAEELGDLLVARQLWAKVTKLKEEPRRPAPSEKRSFGLLAASRLSVLDEVDRRETNLFKNVTKEGISKDFKSSDGNEKKAAEALLLELQKSPNAAKAWEEFQANVDRDATVTQVWWLVAAKHLHALKKKEK